MEVPVEVADLLEQFGRLLRRVAADLEQSECERGELVSEGDARETDRDVVPLRRTANDGRRVSSSRRS